MKREDISFYATIITAVVTVILAVLAVYEFFKKASSPERLALLGGVGALFLVLTFLLARRTRAGPRFLRLALSISMGAIRFAKQNVMLLVSLVAVCVLLVLLVQRTQDIVVAGIATGLVPAIVCLALGAVRLLAMTRPSFLGLAVQAAEIREAPAVPKGLWSYDFIEHFNDPTTRKSAEQSDHIQVMQKAQSLGVVRPAIYEHPRASGQTVVTYVVEKIPEHVREVRLEFFFGILDRVHNKTKGLTEVSKFHTTPGNKIEFEIQVNEEPVFGKMRDRVGWSSLQQVRGLSPFSGALEVSFRTDALGGDPRWNWAAWGEPRLVEVKPTSSAAG